MLIRTHLKLAAKLLREAEREQYGTCSRMERLAFYWGNVRPDVHSPFNRRTHMYEKSIDEIERRWKRIEDAGGVRKARDMYRLGYILHFTADFFTYVHNSEEGMTEMRRHMLYEQRLGRRMQGADCHCMDIISPDDFRDYIELLHDIYLEEEGSPQRDVDFICAGTWTLMKKAMDEFVCVEEAGEDR